MLWNPADGTERPAPGPNGAASALRFSPDGRTLAAVGKGGRLWDLPTRGSPGRRLSEKDQRDNSRLAFTSDGLWVLYACGTEEPPGFHAVTSEVDPIYPLRPAWDTPCTAVAAGPEATTVAAAGEKESRGWIKLWHAPSGNLLRTVSTEGGADSLAFSKDGKRLFATRGHSKKIFVHDLLGTGPPLAFEGHGSSGRDPVEVCEVAVSPDGKQVASCDASGVVIVWDSTTLKTDRTFDLSPPYSGEKGGGVRTVTWAPDGRHLLTCNADGTAFIIRLAAFGKVRSD